MTRVPKASQGMVATLVRTIFEQPDHDSVWAQHARVVGQLSGRFDDAANMLADAAEDLLAFATFPAEHSAPRGALTYPPRSGEGLEVISLGSMADLDSKEKKGQ
jgi:hypothetical protein